MAGVVGGIAVDFDNDEICFYLKCRLVTCKPGKIAGETWTPFLRSVDVNGRPGGQMSVNFGQTPFKYAPAGFSAPDTVHAALSPVVIRMRRSLYLRGASR